MEERSGAHKMVIEVWRSSTSRLGKGDGARWVGGGCGGYDEGKCGCVGGKRRDIS